MNSLKHTTCSLSDVAQQPWVRYVVYAAVPVIFIGEFTSDFLIIIQYMYNKHKVISCHDDICKLF